MRRFDPDTVQNGHIYVFIYWVYLGIFCGFNRLRILVMDEMSLEV